MIRNSGHRFSEKITLNTLFTFGLTLQAPRRRPMPSIRRAIIALSIACAAAAFAASSAGPALAQAKMAPPPAAAPQAPPPMKQIPLTEKQIEGVLAAQQEMDPITDKLPDNAPPDKKVIAQLDGIAKKHGFAGYADYNNVVENITLILGGFDPATKKFVGSTAAIKAQIAQIQADKKMAAKDKKEAIDELNQALKAPEPVIENKGNIDLVAKYYDKLAAAFAEGDN
jgi:hypothetical protein